MRNSVAALALMTCCASCTPPETPENGQNIDHADAADALAPADQGIGPDPETPPDDRNLVSEGPIDPKSGQGAGQVLQGFAALLEQRRFTDARRLWAQSGAGDQQAFERSLGKYAEIHAEIGAPGQIEGAAGSVYVGIPVRFYGELKTGRSFSSAGTATLRRVNDVPGSTAEERQWRIYRIDVQPPL